MAANTPFIKKLDERNLMQTTIKMEDTSSLNKVRVVPNRDEVFIRRTEFQPKDNADDNKDGGYVLGKRPGEQGPLRTQTNTGVETKSCSLTNLRWSDGCGANDKVCIRHLRAFSPRTMM